MKFVQICVILTIFLKGNGICKSRRGPVDRIIGGMRVGIYTYPATVCLILKGPEGDDFRGGAVIISQYWVVTAAHCMNYITDDDVDDKAAYVRGNTAAWKKHYLEHLIIERHVHEKYDRSLTDYDIAVLKVQEPFNGLHEKPAQLAESNYKYDAGSIAATLGWGTTDPLAAEPFVVHCLRMVNIKIKDQSTCRNFYRLIHEDITNRMVCAVAPGKDACVFDSGGPLYQNGYLIGLVSWGSSKCGDEKLPGVYTRLSIFYDWIVDTAGDLNDTDYENRIQNSEAISLYRRGNGLSSPNYNHQIHPMRRIIGGRLASIQDFPSTACLVIKTLEGLDFRGGAVIISKYWVLTAAHCMDFISPSDVEKRTAFVRSNSKNWKENYNEHVIIGRYVHEQYNYVLTDYDIAALKVEEPFNGLYEKPVKLPTSDYKYVEDSTATVVGWGTTDPSAVEAFVVNDARFGTIRISNFNTCKKAYNVTDELVTNRMICASAPGRDACIYDSGGPLYQHKILIGLVSWGGPICADEVLPGVYTKVSEFSNWIINITTANTSIR